MSNVMRKATLLRLRPLLLCGLFLLGMGLIQFATPDLPDNDGFYHIKLASLMRTEGLKPDFPWLPLTVLNEREFYDHHFLFHVLLIPFTLGDLHLGAKWAAVVFASLAFMAIWYLFHRQRVPYDWLWALALLGCSEAFLYRMSITRAQSLSLGLLALACICLLEGRHRWLGVLAFLYVWLYNAYPLLLGFGLLYTAAVFLMERRLELKPLLYILGGLLLGMLLNPYFPDNLVFSFRHFLPKLTDATSISVGNEWYPYETKTLLQNSLPALLAFASGCLALGLAGRAMATRTAFALLTALLFAFMLFEARRFVEYFPAFAVVFAAFAWSPLLEPAEGLPIESGWRRWLAPAVLLLAVAAGLVVSIPKAQASLRTSRPYGLYAGASQWLVANTPAGSRVFQTDWDDFPRLFFYNTHNTYLVGLDPTYMQLYNAELYDRWVMITQGQVANPSGPIADTFGSQYVHSDLQHGAFLTVASQDPGLREVYRDDEAVIFEVQGP